MRLPRCLDRSTSGIDSREVASEDAAAAEDEALNGLSIFAIASASDGAMRNIELAQSRIILGTMTPEELDSVKKALRTMQDSTKEVWIEKQLMRNLILDSGWMTEPDLDSAVERGKKQPANILLADQFFAAAEQKLAEIGLAAWLADFDQKYPRSDNNPSTG